MPAMATDMIQSASHELPGIGRLVQQPDSPPGLVPDPNIYLRSWQFTLCTTLKPTFQPVQNVSNRERAYDTLIMTGLCRPTFIVATSTFRCEPRAAGRYRPTIVVRGRALNVGSA